MMSGANRFRIVSLLLLVAAPPVWLACGGGEPKPAESAADESSASGSSDAPPASSDSAAESASAAPAEKADTTPSAEPAAESSPPPSPNLGNTDCGACIDKACAKPAAACGKNTDCQSTLDSIHGCSSGAASCISGATAPTGAKPKKLAGAFEACAKKALAGKTCKAKCQ
jgi:hypothetical protein